MVKCHIFKKEFRDAGMTKIGLSKRQMNHLLKMWTDIQYRKKWRKKQRKQRPMMNERDWLERIENGNSKKYYD